MAVASKALIQYTALPLLYLTFSYLYHLLNCLEKIAKKKLHIIVCIDSVSCHSFMSPSLTKRGLFINSRSGMFSTCGHGDYEYVCFVVFYYVKFFLAALRVWEIKVICLCRRLGLYWSVHMCWCLSAVI